MGWQSTVSGYITVPIGSEKQSAEIIESFDYNKTYLFRNVFGKPMPAYQESIIGFADSLKATVEESMAWVARFEELILELNAVSAKVEMDCETESDRKTYFYVRVGEKWTKYSSATVDQNQTESNLSNTAPD